MMSIRAAVPEDIPAMLAIYAPYVEHTAVSFEYVTPTAAEFALRLQAHSEYPWLVWEENGRVLGYAYAGRAFERAAYRWCAEISCYLAQEARGHGIGRKLYTEIEALLLRQGVRKLFAVVTSDNAPSVAFHQALGFKQTAYFPNVGYKNGAWYGVTWLEKQLQPLGTPEAFPIPWRECK